jgi:hypothetical protein
LTKFGGLDIALRVDSTVLISLNLSGGVLEESGLKTWHKINYNKIKDDLLKINRVEKFRAICFDRLGSGEVVTTFPRELPLRDVVSSQVKKLDLIGLVKGLFHDKKLLIHSEELLRETLEQITYKSDAGNVLYRHPSGHHDDRFWALAYACEAARPYILGVPKYTAATARKKPLDANDDFDRLLSRI